MSKEPGAKGYRQSLVTETGKETDSPLEKEPVLLTHFRFLTSDQGLRFLKTLHLW